MESCINAPAGHVLHRREKPVENASKSFKMKGIYVYVDKERKPASLDLPTALPRQPKTATLIRNNPLIYTKGLIKMAHESVLCVRVTEDIHKELKRRYPDAKMRANVLRALVQKFIMGKLPPINSYEYKELRQISNTWQTP